MFVNSSGTFDANELNQHRRRFNHHLRRRLPGEDGLRIFNGGFDHLLGGTFTGATGNVTTTNMILSSGTLTALSGTFDVSGNWNSSGVCLPLSPEQWFLTAPVPRYYNWWATISLT